MKSILLIFAVLLLSVSCNNIQESRVSNEEFISDVLTYNDYYSVDDHNHSKVFVLDSISSVLFFGGNFSKSLPDSCYTQMRKMFKKDSNKHCALNMNEIHAATDKNVHFISQKEAESYYSAAKADYFMGSKEHQDSCIYKLEQENPVWKKYDTSLGSSGYYRFYMPIFDANGKFALFYYKHYCNIGKCANGSWGLYTKVKGHWQKIENGGINVE